VKRFLLVLTVAAIVSAMLTIGASWVIGGWLQRGLVRASAPIASSMIRSP
jgi:hypothetical protein